MTTSGDDQQKEQEAKTEDVNEQPKMNGDNREHAEKPESNHNGTIELDVKNEDKPPPSDDNNVTKPPTSLPPPPDDKPPEKIEISVNEKWRILKNVAAISAAFMVHFTAFQGTANLQSSINATGGLGTMSLSVIYLALVVSCIFVPTFMIKMFSVKWTMCLSMLCYIPYICAQFYPKFYTLVPAGVLLGIGAAPMWAAKATYLTQVASIYATLTDQRVDAIIVRFFGFFFLAWQTAELWGNLISSLVLSSDVHGGGHHPSNETNYEDIIQLCGANFSVSNSATANQNLERPPDAEIFEITAIYLAFVFMAVGMMAFLVDPLSRYGEKSKNDKKSEKLTAFQLISATAYQLKKPKQLLLIPLTLLVGMEQAFVGADFTQAYVSCSLGIHSIGYVMICFGLVNAFCSVILGTLMKFIGRFPILCFGAVLHGSLIVGLLIWKPHPDNWHLFYVFSGLWGVGDAVWQTQLNGLYGTLFRRNKEAAFSNYRLWESMGFVIAYAYSNYLAVWKKLYVMMSTLLVGVLGYAVVEILQIRKTRVQVAPGEAAVTDTEKRECHDEEDDIDNNIILVHL